MEFLIGVILAVAVGLFATFTGLDRDKAFYPTVMIVIALYYALFAVIGGSAQALLVELLVILVFVGASVAGFKYSLWLVVAALAAHGVYDLAPDSMFVTPGVPPWWPYFCLAYDCVAAGYLAWRLLASREASLQGPR
ncbi:MAG: hypothetical protein RL120_10230 [Gammaproteobacteria bacterium]